ncbi:hypothetical protein DSO57_1022082 [Entomophthora muscae]|uniref:Uncharacterized protein n=1 Tax=Entomophthora muscae TaxID=34485 RepID=A0ACC2TQQ8_9FUNG|nr:hypothetical protein DSO57_1022082 [Entomophthora muscae]
MLGTGAPYTYGSLNGHQTSIILDSCTYSNTILGSFLASLGRISVVPSDTTYVMADDSEKSFFGKAINLRLQIDNIVTFITAAVFPYEQYMLLLGSETLTVLGLMRVKLKDLTSCFSAKIVTDADDLPEAIGVEHEINTGDTKPIMSYPYWLPHSKELFVQTEISQLLKKGMIKPSKSP